jgi:Spy/CpxP family protein refolding chaperone
MHPGIKRIVLGTGIIAATAAIAACGHYYYSHDPASRAEHIVEHVSEDLALNPAQIDKLKALKTELLNIGQQWRSEHDKTRERALALIAQPTLDRTAVLTLITERTQAVTQHAPQVVAVFGDFYDSLACAPRTGADHRRLDRVDALRARTGRRRTKAEDGA